jgi:hypothetical protein
VFKVRSFGEKIWEKGMMMIVGGFWWTVIARYLEKIGKILFSPSIERRRASDEVADRRQARKGVFPDWTTSRVSWYSGHEFERSSLRCAQPEAEHAYVFYGEQAYITQASFFHLFLSRQSAAV